MKNLIRTYLAEEGGVAAVEMALILPFIASFAVISINVWDVGMRKQDMRGALKLGAQYYMNGGQDDTASRAIALAQWNHKPATSDITITRSYYCPDATTVTNATTLCADNTVPQTLVLLHGSATTSTAMFSKTMTADEYVRIR
jgi:Flp pilus assembly protein TadG